MTATTKITVVPAPGLLVLDPATGQPLPSAEKRPKGTRVQPSTYWHKRVASGDVQQLLEPAAAPEAANVSAPEAAPDEAAPAVNTEAAPASKPSKPKDK